MSRPPDRSVHDFKCPDCGGWCQLIQEGLRASMRHQVPMCKTYLATRKDGQKFLELAYVTYPQTADKPDPIMVAFREGPKPAELPAKPDEPAAELAEVRYLPSAGRVAESTDPGPSSGAYGHAGPGTTPDAGAVWSATTETRKPYAPPPRWQPMLEQLATELRSQVYDRGVHSTGLAQAIAEANADPTKPQHLVGFDDTKIAGLAKAIAELCSASKGWP